MICYRFNITNLQKQLIEYLSSVVRDYKRAVSEYRSRGYDLNHMDKELGFLDDGIQHAPNCNPIFAKHLKYVMFHLESNCPALPSHSPEHFLNWV